MKNYLALFANAIIVLIITIALGRIIMAYTGILFGSGLIFIILFFGVCIYGLIYFRTNGRKWLLAGYSVVLLALLAMATISSIRFPLMIIAGLGFFVSFPSKEVRKNMETHNVLLDPSPVTSELKNTPKLQKVDPTYIPGKYVASNRSNQYHEPICDWAKKIRPERQLWFKEKENAWERGFRAHSCVKA